MRPWLSWLVLLTACSETELSSIETPKTPGDPSTTTPETGPTTVSTTTPTTPDTTTTPPPLEPIAEAGADLQLVAGDLADLDGGASWDPNGGAVVAWEWSIASQPPGSTAILTSISQVTTVLTTDVHGTYELDLTVQNDAGVWDSTPDRVVIEAEAAPPVADAGPDDTYTPLSTVVLDGGASYDPEGLEPLLYSWTLVSKPANSNAVLDDPTSPTPSFFAELAGDYVFELSVTNTLGVVDPTPDTVTITTTPADGFYVELSWTGNGDLDLHLLNSLATGIFDCPNDCNYDKPNPSWGVAGNADDPSLDEDTVPGQSGSGPEIITIDAPSTDVYTVKVHYFGKDNKSTCTNCPDADATVNIYLGGVLAATYTGTLLEDDDVWTVATIDWPSGLIQKVDTLGSTTKTVCF